MNDMDYELAKQLKDAGFPQDKIGLFFVKAEAGYPPFMRFINGAVDMQQANVLCAAPMLEQLIEACGDKLDRLERSKVDDPRSSKWVAWHLEFVEETDEFEELIFGGSTPTEAVGRLWLALNKK